MGEKKLKRAEEEAKKEAEEKARKEEEAEYVRKFVEQKMKERKAAIAAEKEAKKASWSKFLKDQGEKNAKRENDAREKNVGTILCIQSLRAHAITQQQTRL